MERDEINSSQGATRQDDLVKRLRGWARDILEGSTAIWAMDQDLKEAADRIEELEATLLATCKREAATQARHDAKVTALEARAERLACFEIIYGGRDR